MIKRILKSMMSAKTYFCSTSLQFFLPQLIFHLLIKNTIELIIYQRKLFIFQNWKTLLLKMNSYNIMWPDYAKLGIRRKNLLQETVETFWIKRRISNRYWLGIMSHGFICKLYFLSCVVSLQYINYTKIENNIVHLKKLGFSWSRIVLWGDFTICLSWHVHT